MPVIALLMKRNMKSTFKQRKSFDERKQESYEIKVKYPQKVPVICERFFKEKMIPHLDKTKFLVPAEITMSQLVTVLRNRMALKATQSLYVVVNGRSLASMASTLAEVYQNERDEDGFLYMTYASQEMFG